MKYLMMTIQIEAPAAAVPGILEALTPHVPNTAIRLFESQPLPAPPPAADADAPLVAAIGTAVRPQPHHGMRREALEAALGGYDSFTRQQGEADPSMRNALGSLSKALKAVFPHDASPIDRLARRTKHYSPDGHYLGTRYTATPLGRKVRDLLEAEGAIFAKV